jgi:3-hydroxymyristoyl/3-hydroxydecanoyl-(acyl carrier protein) dehydratase
VASEDTLPARQTRGNLFGTGASVSADVFMHPVPGGGDESVMLRDAVLSTAARTMAAHDAYLRFSESATRELASILTMQAELLESAVGKADGAAVLSEFVGGIEMPIPPRLVVPPVSLRRDAEPAFSRELCLEFARGKVANVLGLEFAVIDGYRTRVRLPDEPLMLVDRILSVEGTKSVLGPGRVVTEHDVLPGAWYLDADRCPICITVEAGQADLFLSGYLGIDFVAKGIRSYRLLDATVTFHRGLPRSGETIHYDIRIDRFVRQGETYMFFFEFDGTIDGEPVLTMRKGCAGFFTAEEIRQSHGLVLRPEEAKPSPRTLPDGFAWPVAVDTPGVESFGDDRIAALRRGDLAGCFGQQFAGLALVDPPRLPGGRMKLIDRVLELNATGGRYGLGMIYAEADVHPDDWYLTCHFVDDMVMPGTLMYECTVHTLRVFLLRMGWIADQDELIYEPIPGMASALRCRGPVTPATKKASYRVEIKEVGYRPEPYVLADALMYADGVPIVQMNNMSLQLTGLTRERVESLWRGKSEVSMSVSTTRRGPVFSGEQILAFAVGKPSDCFGEPYRIFDGDNRRIARLPGPPYQFLDRVMSVEPPPFALKADGWIEAEYDVPADAWYFAANRQSSMPFAVFLEIALQPCGFLAAYAGSALTSEHDLSFRNLGGEATLHEEVFADAGTLRIRVRMTNVSRAGGMIIENFDMMVLRGEQVVYDGTTSFGFFSKEALERQVGIRDAGQRRYMPTSAERTTAKSFALPNVAPMTPDDAGAITFEEQSVGAELPAKAFRMLDQVDALIPDGGPHGLGFVQGSAKVDPSAWFFKAHFYQDPVWPGSLGLESMLQLMKAFALDRWPQLAATHRFEPIAVGMTHEWIYRGQIIPTNEHVEVQATIIRCEEGEQPLLVADGFLSVDGTAIYEMKQFGLRMVPM